MMKNTVVIFSLVGCHHCRSLKSRLNDLSITYIDIDIERNPEIWNSVFEQTKENLVPTVFIKKEGSEDGPVFVPERDFKNEDEIVEIIKKYQ